jgi:excinuclease UvrABC nuclease subunit
VAVVRRWNAKPFNRANIESVTDVLGVYALLTASGYVNFIGDAANIYLRLRRHLDEGDIPATSFTAWQMDSRESARRYARQLIEEYEPYYND